MLNTADAVLLDLYKLISKTDGIANQPLYLLLVSERRSYKKNFSMIYLMSESLVLSVYIKFSSYPLPTLMYVAKAK